MVWGKCNEKVRFLRVQFELGEQVQSFIHENSGYFVSDDKDYVLNMDLECRHFNKNFSRYFGQMIRAEGRITHIMELDVTEYEYLDDYLTVMELENNYKAYIVGSVDAYLGDYIYLDVLPISPMRLLVANVNDIKVV